MEIEDLIIFKTLAKGLRITKLVKKLNYVEFNIMLRIKRLNSEFGVQLLYRRV